MSKRNKKIEENIEGKESSKLDSRMKSREIEKSALKKILDHLEKDLKK